MYMNQQLSTQTYKNQGTSTNMKNKNKTYQQISTNIINKDLQISISKHQCQKYK